LAWAKFAAILSVIILSVSIISLNFDDTANAMKGKGVFLLDINATGSHVCGLKLCFPTDPFAIAKAIEKEIQVVGIEKESKILFGLAGKISEELYPNYEETSSGELTAVTNEKPFGGRVVGHYQILQDNEEVIIVIESQPPSLDTVLEGWLVDSDSGYALSLGKFDADNNILYFKQRMVNPLIYDVLEVTEEPINDVNPKPHTTIGGVPVIDLVEFRE